MEPITRITENIDWITLVLLGSLLLIVIAKKFFYSRFLNFIILPFNNKYIIMYNKKEKLFSWFHILLTTFQIINISLFAFFSWKAYWSLEPENSRITFSLIFGLLFLFLIVKMFLQLANGFIFGSYRLISELLFKKTSYLNYSSLVLFLANVLLSFVYIDSINLVLLAITIFIIINIIGWVTVIRIHQKFISSYFFYFILYLCALEIAPLIILGSFLK
ncbi:DUF4271 domain-containing protein [Maribacter sp. PR1]|uniref:DUF4271 domain-containing protein n=1 Tax=Maribacter cobaltidurans TaxID=1178778 RepID=A0ABU7IRJ7_9FLAO|nr:MULTISPECIES: DUF4271 domain-containing protein [Maribacter]MDC6388204.1 DUF4271 domain-containing protein [Maribacter sp. PR1]MEE1975592.1 DUF4271 domain-containing protein [Maribacter cobaltidurans]